uniref:Uncharacterized protein n=1 Tax=Sinocyclocheilus rhinocerous TaxID=307959 RepID=A0A673MRE0_9TELE
MYAFGRHFYRLTLRSSYTIYQLMHSLGIKPMTFHSSSSSFHCSVFTRSLFPPVWPYPHSVSWDRKNNPEPWNNLGPTYQYKVNIPVTAL